MRMALKCDNLTCWSCFFFYQVRSDGADSVDSHLCSHLQLFISPRLFRHILGPYPVQWQSKNHLVTICSFLFLLFGSLVVILQWFLRTTLQMLWDMLKVHRFGRYHETKSIKVAGKLMTRTWSTIKKTKVDVLSCKKSVKKSLGIWKSHWNEKEQCRF